MSINNICDVIISLASDKEEITELCSHFYKNPEKINDVMNILNKFSTPDLKLGFLRKAILTTGTF